jgi:Domain of unknown function (DUF222)/HNH endonuclease
VATDLRPRVKSALRDTANGGSSEPGRAEKLRLGPKMGAASSAVDWVMDALDAECLPKLDASAVYTWASKINRQMEAVLALVAPVIESSGIWKEKGERSCASYLASLEGVSAGQARATLDVGRALTELPKCEKAARDGLLSRPKLIELTTALASNPSSESALLASAASEPLWATKERCQRARATNRKADPLAATRRIRAARHLTWWSDAEGAFCFKGRDTADRGALMRARLDALANEIRRERAGSCDTPDSPRESDGALRSDALFSLLADRTTTLSKGREQKGRPSSAVFKRTTVKGRQSTVKAGSPTANARRSRENRTNEQPSIVTRPPQSTIFVHVDLSALLRGQAHPGECCEIDGHGPIPVPMARDLANDSFLRLVFHQSGDIRAVSTFGRTINRRLRTALAARDRRCVVPGCGATTGLEIDHVVPFADGGPTELDNLALLCHHHHFLKTFEGWTLKRIPDEKESTHARWRFEPPPAFGQEPGLGIDTDEGRAEWRRQRE